MGESTFRKRCNQVGGGDSIEGVRGERERERERERGRERSRSA